MSFNEVDQSTAELTQIAGSTLTSVYADAPIGAISAYGGDTAPTGWLICDGSAISRTTYADLYAVIGTKFGAGDGSTTFNLPDGSISAAVYPVEDVGEYIIKAVQTSVPADFETALALKQDITDNTLETSDQTVPGAINEINGIVSATISRTRTDITDNLDDLEQAVADQDLAKYEYKIGDYFTGPVSGYIYSLAHMNPYKAAASHYAATSENHIGIVVDTQTTSAWLSSGSAGSYKDSTLHTLLAGDVLNNIKSDMISLFGGSTGLEHLIATDKLWNSVGSWAWSSSGTQSEYITALTESMVYGAPIWSGDNFQQGEGCCQLELFRKHFFVEIFGNISVWLRSLSSASAACLVSGPGYAYFTSLSGSGRAAGLILFK